MKSPEEVKKALSCCAKASLEECDHCPYGSDCDIFEACNLYRDALAYINRLEARVPKWISVEERLPEDQRSVLTVNGHGEIRIMGLWSKCDDKWTWVHNDRMMHYNDITHWMLLPGIPKEE